MNAGRIWSPFMCIERIVWLAKACQEWVQRTPQPLLLIPGGIAGAPSNPQDSGHGSSSASSMKNSLESLIFCSIGSRVKILGEYIQLGREVGSDSHQDTYAGEVSRQTLSLYFALTHIFW